MLKIIQINSVSSLNISLSYIKQNKINYPKQGNTDSLIPDRTVKITSFLFLYIVKYTEVLYKNRELNVTILL